jgi:hypothetical protein
VETDVLESEEVLAGGGGGWDLEGPLAARLVPGDAGRGDGGWALLPDLEPVSVTVPVVNVSWGLGEVGSVWAWVNDILVNAESNLVAC